MAYWNKAFRRWSQITPGSREMPTHSRRMSVLLLFLLGWKRHCSCCTRLSYSHSCGLHHPSSCDDVFLPTEKRFLRDTHPLQPGPHLWSWQTSLRGRSLWFQWLGSSLLLLASLGGVALSFQVLFFAIRNITLLYCLSSIWLADIDFSHEIFIGELISYTPAE